MSVILLNKKTLNEAVSLNFLILLFLFICIHSGGFAQQTPKYEIFSRTEQITIDGDGVLQRQVINKGKVGDAPLQIQISHHNREQLVDIQAKYKTSELTNFVNNNKNIVDLPQTDVSDPLILKQIEFKPNVIFEYSFLKKTEDLFLLSPLELFSEVNTDTLVYTIIVAKPYKLKIQNVNINAEAYKFTMDSTKNSEQAKYTIKAIFQAGVEGKTKTVLKKNKVPQIKFFVFHEKYASNPNAFLNEKLGIVLKSVNKLNKESQVFFEKIFDGVQKGDSFVFELFSAVKSQINSIQKNEFSKYPYPADPNMVLSQKKGSCADVANLLCEAYKKFGFEAYLALIPSKKNGEDLVFPGLNEVSNLICAVKIKGKWLFLNPLEELNSNLMNLNLEQKHVFVLNNKVGEWVKVEKGISKKQSHDFKMDILFEDFFEFMNGTYSYQGNFFDTTTTISLEEDETYIPSNDDTIRYLENFSRGLLFQNYYPSVKGDFILMEGDINLSRKFVINIGKRYYISLKFLPFPHNLPMVVADDEALNIKEQQSSGYLKLRFISPVKIFEELSAKYDENGIKFSLNAIQTSEKEFEIKYSYSFERQTMNDKQSKTFNKVNNYMLDSFTKMLTFDKFEE